MVKSCSVSECGRPVFARGWCEAHWYRWRHHGDVMVSRPIGAPRTGEFNSKWRGGQVIIEGRVAVYSPGHPYPNACGVYVFRYRLVMEKHLGRYLLPSELVHHKNENPTDDRLENLELTDHSEHAKLHNGQRQRNSKGQFAS